MLNIETVLQPDLGGHEDDVAMWRDADCVRTECTLILRIILIDGDPHLQESIGKYKYSTKSKLTLHAQYYYCLKL